MAVHGVVVEILHYVHIDITIDRDLQRMISVLDVSVLSCREA